MTPSEGPVSQRNDTLCTALLVRAPPPCGPLQLFTFLSRLTLAKAATEDVYSRTLQVLFRPPPLCPTRCLIWHRVSS